MIWRFGLPAGHQGGAILEQRVQPDWFGKIFAGGDVPPGLGGIGGDVDHRKRRISKTDRLGYVPPCGSPAQANIRDQESQGRRARQHRKSRFSTLRLYYLPALRFAGRRQFKTQEPFILDNQHKRRSGNHDKSDGRRGARQHNVGAYAPFRRMDHAEA